MLDNVFSVETKANARILGRHSDLARAHGTKPRTSAAEHELDISIVLDYVEMGTCLPWTASPARSTSHGTRWTQRGRHNPRTEPYRPYCLLRRHSLPLSCARFPPNEHVGCDSGAISSITQKDYRLPTCTVDIIVLSYVVNRQTYVAFFSMELRSERSSENGVGDTEIEYTSKEVMFIYHSFLLKINNG